MRHREPHPLAAGIEVRGAGPHQTRELVFAATHRGDPEWPVWRKDATVGNCGEGIRLRDEGFGRAQLAREEVDADTRDQSQRQFRECADLSR